MKLWVRILRWTLWAAVGAMVVWAILDWNTFTAFVNNPDKLGSYFPGLLAAGTVTGAAVLQRSKAERQTREEIAEYNMDLHSSRRRRGQQQQQQQQQMQEQNPHEQQFPDEALRESPKAIETQEDEAQEELNLDEGYRGQPYITDLDLSDAEDGLTLPDYLEVLEARPLGTPHETFAAHSESFPESAAEPSTDVVKEVPDAIAPSQPSDRVESTLYAPAVCRPGATIRVQAFFHTRADRDAARAEALEFDPATGMRAREWLSAPVMRGQQIDVALRADSPGFEIKSADRMVVWEGEPVSADFLVAVSADVQPTSAGFSAVVFIGGRPVGELAFTLSVVAATESPVALRYNHEADAAARPFRSVFVSYSRVDLDQVRLVVRTLQLAEKEYFLDMEHLRSGQEWEEKLYERIDASDAFVLCWSKSASQSVNVRKEVARALEAEKARGRPCFIPFPLDGPPPTEPWTEIAHRHIGDNVYYRNAQAALRRDQAN